MAENGAESATNLIYLNPIVSYAYVTKGRDGTRTSLKWVRNRLLGLRRRNSQPIKIVLFFIFSGRVILSKSAFCEYTRILKAESGNIVKLRSIFSFRIQRYKVNTKISYTNNPPDLQPGNSTIELQVVFLLKCKRYKNSVILQL